MRAFLCGVVFCSLVAIAYSTVIFFAFPLKYKEDIKDAATNYDISTVLIASIIRTESNFDKDAISPKGAVGLMQIMPSTGDFIAEKMSIGEYDLTDPAQNIRMGTYYFKYLLDKFKDVKTALFAYNAGEGNVVKWLGDAEKLNTTPYPEANKYAERVLNRMNYYRYRV